MNVIIQVLNFISQEILNVPAYLIGIVAVIGLIALKRSAGQVISGGLKAAMGYLILGAGATVVTGALSPFGDLVLKSTGAQGVVPTNEVITAQASSQYGATSAYIIVLSFLVMLLFARFTPLKYVFLTGHHMVFMSTLLAVVLSVGLGSDNQLLVILVGAALMAVVMVVLPAFAQPFMNRVTGNDKLAIGHFNTLGYIISGAVGTKVGKKSRSTEDINFPKGLNFLRDSMVSTTVLMIVLYLVFSIWGAIVLPAKTAFAIFPSHPANYGAFFMAAFAQALQFGIGVSIILYGVRIILGELVPAFQGIANKVVPGAKPALDVPIVFPFGANASLIGFLSSFAGGLVALVIIAVWLGPVWGIALILPGMVPHFFDGGGAGVFGNATGGRIGSVVGGFINGMLITFLPAALMTVMGSFGIANSTFGDADFGWFGTIVGNIAHLGTVGGAIGLMIFAAVLLAGAWVWQVKVVDKGWMPAQEHANFINDIKAAEKAEKAARKNAQKATAAKE
ncbi:PTS ascorbate transporter subunit IIC [Bifidobacterium crudilactis]|jgi:PTS system ascorbate-specific IIC component|uniref:PTS ascorbate transporter subunit IIC n=1 Tax=Bifidobacterium crudilactis TaxID=327277 RepID=UPI002356C52B|nr:PTS ascorbate transporter subunit IIC [Bifidobacterium crudilactis]MCI1217187.1 PTS ascorbate transporter subunit IIC [Bifidobacterium crudilactis]MCI1637055.1 PTS ascorbate transporter subunit IIC [Bifidobacterium crudilactis]MCI1642969.1 PTS ascorbate transporter subunit IIC [Bifidobacterium crudilactis]MCI1889104.1 PTS ascorbate transporter subunit IIC [Bifidobacterium crudilactis]